MKKLMAFVFALALVLGLAACSAQEEQKEELTLRTAKAVGFLGGTL